MEDTQQTRRMSMTDGVRVDIEGQFNPNNPLKSCQSCKKGSSIGLHVIRDQLSKEMQYENWQAFCDDADLEMSRMERIKNVYYPLSGLMAFLFVLFVWVPMLLLRQAFFSEENGEFSIGYYMGWLLALLVPSIAYLAIRYRMHVVTHDAFEEVRDVCVEKSIINEVRYELHEEKWGKFSCGIRHFIIVRNFAQNKNHVTVQYVDNV